MTTQISADPSGPEEPTAAAPGVRRRALRAVLPIAVPVLVACLVAAGYLMIHAPGRAPRVDRGAAAAPPSPAVDMTGVPNPFRTGPPDLTGPPARLRVPAVGIDTALESLHLGADGELLPPRADERAGWYADGTAPGDVGPAVLAGHVDSKRGPAVFYRLREIEAGDKIEVTRGGRTVGFTVTSTAWYPKRAFPAEQVYGPTPDRQLRLITCGGAFDTRSRSYRDNLVVYAVAG